MVFLPLYDSNPKHHIKYAYVNYMLIGICAVVFAIQSLMPPNQFDQFAISFGMIPVVVRDLVASPLPWLPDQATLITYMFLHADWWHLLFNMLFLFIFGDNVEDAMGHVRYLVFYLSCGVIAAGVHILVFADAHGPLIGASGAVAGVLGAYVMLYPHAKVLILARIVIPIPVPLPAFWVLGFWIASQIFFALTDIGGEVAWWAHIGGVIAGALLAFTLSLDDLVIASFTSGPSSTTLPINPFISSASSAFVRRCRMASMPVGAFIPVMSNTSNRRVGHQSPLPSRAHFRY